MFQCVMLSISSSVIMFHRERKECGPENGKNGGRSRNNAPKPESGKKGEAYGQPQPIEEKRQGRHGKRRQTARTARKRQRKNCNMQSWERAQPLSPFEVSPDGTGRRFCLENSGWRDPLGYHNAAKYPPADFFIDYRREFYVPKTEGLNVQVFALRVTFLMGLGKGSDINKPGYCYWRNLVLFPFFSNRIIALQIIFTTFAT